MRSHNKLVRDRILTGGRYGDRILAFAIHGAGPPGRLGPLRVRPPMRRVVRLAGIFVLVLALLLPAVPAASAQQAACVFQLGFKAIAEQIPEIVLYEAPPPPPPASALAPP